MDFLNFKKKDWKQFLNVDDEKILNDFITKTLKHRGAYKNSQDVKSAQLWCAILEIRKENLILQKKVQDYEQMFEAMFDKMKKKDEERTDLAKSLEQF